MSKHRYIRAKGIKALAKEYGKICSADFLQALDRRIERLVINLATQFNGHRKKITAKLLEVKNGRI